MLPSFSLQQLGAGGAVQLRCPGLLSYSLKQEARVGACPGEQVKLATFWRRRREQRPTGAPCLSAALPPPGPQGIAYDFPRKSQRVQHQLHAEGGGAFCQETAIRPPARAYVGLAQLPAHSTRLHLILHPCTAALLHTHITHSHSAHTHARTRMCAQTHSSAVRHWLSAAYPSHTPHFTTAYTHNTRTSGLKHTALPNATGTPLRAPASPLTSPLRTHTTHAQAGSNIQLCRAPLALRCVPQPHPSLHHCVHTQHTHKRAQTQSPAVCHWHSAAYPTPPLTSPLRTHTTHTQARSNTQLCRTPLALHCIPHSTPHFTTAYTHNTHTSVLKHTALPYAIGTPLRAPASPLTSPLRTHTTHAQARSNTKPCHMQLALRCIPQPHPSLHHCVHTQHTHKRAQRHSSAVRHWHSAASPSLAPHFTTAYTQHTHTRSNTQLCRTPLALRCVPQPRPSLHHCIHTTHTAHTHNTHTHALSSSTNARAHTCAR